MNRVLLVEDKPSLAEMLREALSEEGWDVESFSDGDQAIDRLRSGVRFSAVLTDLRLPGADGQEVLEAAREMDPLCPVIMMTGYGTIESAVDAMKAGAWDFLQKPVDIDHLMMQLERARKHRDLSAENVLLREEADRYRGLPEIIGASPAIEKVADQVRKVAPTDATVLLRGESGTGKELLARAIHQLSSRAEKPFVPINCAAIPETLIENELFGHEKGSYTGATSRQPGKFELAEGGTIFLDEVGEMAAGTQAKLLRVLEDRTFERIGGRISIHADVRIVCATNSDLEAGVKRGSFREDLLFRISVFPIEVPPLRARTRDIRALAEWFVERHARELGRPVPTISEEALELLERYEWPGNVRELENRLERAVILLEGDRIVPELLDGLDGERREEQHLESLISSDRPLPEVVSEATRIVERLRIAAVLEEEENREAAAEKLGISVRTLQNKIRDYGLS